MFSKILRYFVQASSIIQTKANIKITEQESLLFSSLQQALPSSILRVGGGWVRDKLLGIETTDIDISLDNCTGKEAAEKIKEHIKESSSMGITKTNSDASKHLETACLHIMGFAVDLVNLRSDTYSDTRYPIIVNNIIENRNTFRWCIS